MRPADGCAWITGASSGIGRAVALELARGGWTVVATARRLGELEALVLEASAAGHPGAIFAMPGDVTDRAGMEALVGAIEALKGPIALAFLNAGISPPIGERIFDVEEFRNVLEVNVMGVAHGLGPVLARMAERGRGQVAVNASIAGFGGLPGAAPYCASKTALIHMCESIKFDCEAAGILLQVVNPGFVDTPLVAKNKFPMPFMMSMDRAAKRVVDGFARGRFEVTFPRRLAWAVKALNQLPYAAYFGILGLARIPRGRKRRQ
jgi:NAD(P)-dependent dehydrogenase (short-subunit alcohol dehydrogenase family)